VNLIRLGLPAGLLLFFIWRSLRQRIFLLGIPFLMFMSDAVFFSKLKPFWIPSRLGPSDHIMMWLVVVWVLYFDLLLPRYRRTAVRPPLFGPRLSAPEEIVIVGLAIYVVVEIALTALHYMALGSALGQAKPLLYLLVGYALLRGMFFAASRAETIDFFTALVVVNTIAAGLFVLHQGLHVRVYNLTEYQTIVFQGHRLTRSFFFMPQLLTLAIAFVVAKRRWGPFWLGVLLVTLAALWVSYTRSFLIIAVAEFAVVLGVRLFRAHEGGVALRRFAQLATIAVVFGAIALVALPVQSQYFLSRIHKATSSGSVTGDPNLQNRIDKVRTIYSWIGAESHVLGAGFVSPDQDHNTATMQTMSADLVWVPVLFRLGLIGVVVFLAIYGLAGWRAAVMSLHGRDEAEFLALVFVALAMGEFLQGLVSWTIFNPIRYPMGLWFFAALAAEACRRRVEHAHSQVLAPSAESVASG
jgi:hypothetical protein